MTDTGPVEPHAVIISAGSATVYGIPEQHALVELTLLTSFITAPGEELQMRVVNGPEPAVWPDATESGGTSWRPYEDVIPDWRLSPGEGLKQVTAQYRVVQADGDERYLSPVVSDTVNLSIWWPEGFSDPAFQVQRIPYGAAFGGDYVRGSDWVLGTLGEDLPEEPQDTDTWLVGDVVPAGLPPWQPPPSYDTDGNAILPPPNPVPATLGHAVRWDAETDTWVNIGPTQDLPHTAIRYPSLDEAALEELLEALGRSILHTRPREHHVLNQDLFSKTGLYMGMREIPAGTIEVQWGWPGQNWSEVALVRSAFGRPATVNDGYTVYRRPIAQFYPANPADPLIAPPLIADGPLPTGRWYYYTIFFRVNPTTWVAGMSDSCLLPRDLGHKDHLWDGIPPYYQWTDDNYKEGSGFLRQFMNVFGFELDHTREYVESWQQLYNTDFSPMRLLRHLGANLGVPYEAGVGDINYRSLLSRIGFFFDIRGTRSCLEQVIEAMSKWECTVTPGPNILLLADDSDFFTGTGSWAGLHPDTLLDLSGMTMYLDADESSISTLDPSLWEPNNFVFTCRIQFPPEPMSFLDPRQTIACQAADPVDYSWAIQMQGAGPDRFLTFSRSIDGSPFAAPIHSSGPITGNDLYLRVVYHYTGSAQETRVLISADEGDTWVTSGLVLSEPSPVLIFNSTAPVTIGSLHDGSLPFAGRVYWAEMRYGDDAGPIIWRFDAEEAFDILEENQELVPTTYVDPRGADWTMEKPAITPGSVTFDEVVLTMDRRMPPPPKSGRRTMKVAVKPTNDDVNLVITCGDGIVPAKGRYFSVDDPENSVFRGLPEREVIPLMNGVPVKPTWVYGFSVRLYTKDPGLINRIGVIYFDKDGQPTDLLPVAVTDFLQPAALTTYEWTELSVQSLAPDDSVYLIPVIKVNPVTDITEFWVAGAMVYILGESGAVAAIAPDRFLTLGDPQELIGAESDTYEPYILGEPTV